MAARSVDAVTADALGTLVELVDPVEALREALRGRSVERSPAEVAAAFAAEVDFYLPRSGSGRDQASLALLRRESAAVFLRHLRADIEPSSFAESFVSALTFRPLEGVEAALDALRAAGLTLLCVANWDVGLHSVLKRLELAFRFDRVVTSAEAGAAKPDPAIFQAALAAVGIEPARALHVGDGATDREGAALAGLAFEDVPLATLPERIGIVRTQTGYF